MPMSPLFLFFLLVGGPPPREAPPAPPPPPECAVVNPEASGETATIHGKQYVLVEPLALSCLLAKLDLLAAHAQSIERFYRGSLDAKERACDLRVGACEREGAETEVAFATEIDQASSLTTTWKVLAGVAVVVGIAAGGASVYLMGK